MKRFKFNMVEIALAVAVISIGLSAVLVLFPVGINATRAAMDESSCSDAAECIARYIRGCFLNVWYSNPTESSFSSLNLPSGRPDSAEPTSLSPVSSFPELSSGGGGFFKFTRSGYGGEEIFSAVIRVWRPTGDLTTAASTTPSACPLYVPDTVNGTQRLVTGTPATGIVLPNSTNFDSFAQSVLVEISWPADLPDSDRTNRRVFRVDVYNPYYGIAP